MINFRYHVVSMTAVFLALAIGLVVGTAALNGPAADALEKNVNALRATNSQLRDQVTGLRDQANREEQFVTEAAPILLNGKLTNRRVLLLVLPSGRDQVEGVENILKTAGAKIAGTVELTDKFFNPDNSVELLDLENKAEPASVPTTAIPANSDGVESSSALLAAVLLDRSPAVPAPDRAAVLAAYSKLGYLTTSGAVTGPAEAVVLVSGSPYTDSQAAGKNASVVTTAVQFDHAGVAVVGGVLGGEGNLMIEVRDDATLAKTISTVDNAETVQGQVAAALALYEQFSDSKAGHYGVGPNASALLPQLQK
ncbi:hypothetical protein Cme02nite_71810 [Catellatospora methionotrophica]|uniref:Copper transport outer membrane protein MctB n=1 Tax=Catellatospora methionotrophica TaxID=121620 RepID=A0A8J3LNK6_9ACTN|nr:copper transporter [Catellatospora methionotrophica]GIG18849.1 hypothetical protein Cme02nite_71810 [Catellatospora methionotrophica]